MIIEVRPAEGGDDAKLFMADLADTYTRYLSAKG
jgi:protein subunit release factor A